MGKSQRRAGYEAERQFAKLVGGKRVPLSGAQDGYPGDVIAHGMTFEVKKRRDGFREIYKWLDGADALAMKADRKDWLVTMRLETFLELIDRE